MRELGVLFYGNHSAGRIFQRREKVQPFSQDVEPRLTTLNFQSAVLLVQRVPPQIHHAGRRRGDSGSIATRQKQRRGARQPKTGDILHFKQTCWQCSDVH